MKYNYRIGIYDRTGGFLSHAISKLVILGIGGTVGFYMGAMVVIGEIQASTVTPTPDTATSLSVLPVTTQHFNDLTEPDDVQPALGVGMLQIAMPVNDYQPTEVVRQYQPAELDGQVQPTVLDEQLQGTPLQLN